MREREGGGEESHCLCIEIARHRNWKIRGLFLLFSLSFSQFKRHMLSCYSLLCELLSIELKYEVRCLLRRVFTRIGDEYRICKEAEKGEELV